MNAQKYEYIQMSIDLGDLVQLNRFGSEGWRLVQIVQMEMVDIALLERSVPASAMPGGREGE